MRPETIGLEVGAELQTGSSNHAPPGTLTTAIADEARHVVVDKAVSERLGVARRLQQGLEGSSLQIVPGRGHFLPKDASHEVGEPELLLAFRLQHPAEPESATDPRGR